MIVDSLLSFIPIGAPLSMIGADGVAIPSSNIIDLMGAGVGTAPANVFGNPAEIGSPDAMGVGGIRPELMITVGTTFTTGNAAALTIALQGAADLGTPTYGPDTWTTFAQSPSLAVASLVANTVIWRQPWIPPFPENLRPRYLRLLFSPTAATHFTAGTIAAALPVLVRDDLFTKQAAKNYTV